jgi:hypothetical protein
MAEFDHFCTKDELVALLQTALIDGYVILAKKHLSRPAPEVFTTAEEIAEAVRKGQYAFLLTRPDITRYPVEPILFREDDRQFWYLRPKEGGPVIEIYFFAPFEKNGRRVVPCSSFSYHGKIIRPHDGEYEPSGESIKKAFNSLISSLRKKSRRIQSVKRSAYVSLGVDKLLASGWKLAAPFDTPPVSD